MIEDLKKNYNFLMIKRRNYWDLIFKLCFENSDCLIIRNKELNIKFKKYIKQIKSEENNISLLILLIELINWLFKMMIIKEITIYGICSFISQIYYYIINCKGDLLFDGSSRYIIKFCNMSEIIFKEMGFSNNLYGYHVLEFRKSESESQTENLKNQIVSDKHY